MTVWIERWRDVISSTPELPGVWKRRDGGYHVRARVTCKRTGKLKEVNRALPDIRKAREAFAWLQAESAKVRDSGDDAPPSTVPQFHKYAADVFARKVELGKIRSAAGRAKWATILKMHLVPAFGDVFVDRLRPADIKAWQSKTAAKIRVSKLSPTTANTVLGILRQITSEAIDDFDMRDPMRGIDPFDTREHNPYTEEAPNSLSPADVPRFLETMRARYTQHYAFCLLGIATGLRPSSLRPLRRKGPQADVKWTEGVLLIRRSHTRGDEVMDTTKTDQHQRLHLPKVLIEALEEHVAMIERQPVRVAALLAKAEREGRDADAFRLRQSLRYATKVAESDLLFPSETGAYRASSCLDKPFAAVCKAIALPHPFTVRGLRRTYQDLARAAGIHDAVTRAISGHATSEMQLHYSTASGDEVREALGKVISIATRKAA